MSKKLTKHELSAEEETKLMIQAAEEVMEEYAELFRRLAALNDKNITPNS